MGLLYTLLAYEFTRHLVNELRMNQPRLLRVGMKTLDKQLLALYYCFRHLRDELKNRSVSSQAIY
jgi:hypothetical protein